ncbi:MAG: VanW family protein [Bacillota bacterium]
MAVSKVKLAVIAAAVLVISAAVSFFAAVAVMGKRDVIFSGVRVAGVELGGLKHDEALDRILEHGKALQNKTITVIHPGGRGEFKLKEVGIQIKAGELVEKARSLGRQGSLINQWRERRQIAAVGRDIPLAVTADKKKLQQVLDEITKAVRVPPRDALLVVDPDDTVRIIESADGYGVDIEASWKRLLEVSVSPDESELPVQMVAIRPVRTTEDVLAMGINGVVAKFTTHFDIRKTNRVFNIRVAAQALDGVEVEPGEVFSFNKIVGPRSQEAGYKLAPTILNNEFIDSLGGGVCQVSTTLYNTLLLADVQIIERSSHSLVVSYVPLGQDAAVAYGGKDLRFKNNYGTYLLIKSKVVGNSITFKLFGDVKNKKYVKIINTTLKDYPFKTIFEKDSTLPGGSRTVKQKGVRGYKVVSQRLVYSGGQLIKKEKLPASFYNPLAQIILEGTGRAAPAGPRPGNNVPANPAAPPGSGSTTKPTGPGTDQPVTPPDTEAPGEPPAGDQQDNTTDPSEPGIYPGQ